jgi:hypothetical protein
MKGHQNRRIDDYRQTRLLMFTMVRLMGDSKNAPKTPEALWQLPGDDVKQLGVSDDEARELFKRLGK